MSVEEAIADLTAENEPLDSVLAELSDLTAPELALFEPAWASLAPERRRQIVSRLVELADSSIELSFNGIFKISLNDLDADVRRQAIAGLWESEQPSLVEPLGRLLQADACEAVQAKAAAALGRFAMLTEHGKLPANEAASLSQALLAVIGDRTRTSMIRGCALAAIAPLSIPEVDRVIRESFEDEDCLRLSAIRAMGLNCNSSWLPVLMAELGSPDAESRREAATALGELTEENAVPELCELIYDSDCDVQLAAIRALGEIGGTEARESLKQCLADPDEAISTAAEKALDEVGAKEELSSFEI